MKALEIKTFKNGEFGKLTTLINSETGNVMFVAKEVCDQWGHSNSRKAIKDANLKSEEKINVTKKSFPSFFEQLRNSQLLGSRSSTITLISESGLYKLILKSEKKEAQPFINWVTEDVLPAIRKTGSYIIKEEFTNIGKHTSISIQKQNSKDINSVNFKNGGVSKIIEHSTESCLLHTGKTPKQVRELGKQFGLKSAECKSAKEVLRKVRPDIACGMSFTDNLVKQGFDLNKVAGISNKLAVPLFNELLNLGIRPIELLK